MAAFEPVRYAALTDVGVKRSHNQDACAAQPAVDATGFAAQGHVFVVADGMGGHAVGEKASAKAARDIPFLYTKHARDGGVLPALRRAFQEANSGIHEIGQQNPEFRGLGTTSTALVLRPEGAWIGHVGDSRAYRIRQGRVEQLTFDHSWVWEIAKRQGVDPDELGDFKKNVIIRSLGPDREVEVDIEGPYPVEPGDTFLLCSDGLTGVVTPQEVGAVVSALPPDEAARFLVHLANLRGGPDNITVLIVQVPGGGENSSGARSARPALLARLWSAWNRRVHWSFTVLGGGVGLALLSLGLQLGAVPGAAVLFSLAALLIVVGLGGLAVHMQKEEPPGAGDVAADLAPRELHVYRSHDCGVTPEVLEKFTQLESQLLEGMQAHNTPADYGAHAQLAKLAGAPGAKGEAVLPAFRARCRSILFLAEAFHKSRHKQELFRPSWTPPPYPQ
ncbi:protein phosphatase 2C domain-containing protein [Gemmata sp. JC673]|uniref:Protein phosphatase 2C domain-containing protein n=1 Tax=Gemmata algarum TaxID=2975278 RepID=A0ABU5EV23_9BACT|nr:protein phosphatase 2C domain-containing protein [Gemmata algarum]MDY3557489.1 protein phosphatase 2C domain-containing protein [Gemmata algarum]